MYKFHIQTVQITNFKTIVEALKDVLVDAPMEIDSSGIRITAVDPTQTILVYLRLGSSNFETYNCPEKVVLGINMYLFFKIIKTSNPGDTLTFYMDNDDVNTLGIRIQNSEKNFDIDFKMGLMDLNGETINIPPTKFDFVMTMLSQDFTKMCRDYNQFGNTLDIKCTGRQVCFGIQGDGISSTFTINEGNSDSGLKFKQTPNEDKIIQGLFDLKHLVLFNKCTPLSSNVELYLKNDYPLIIRYVLQLGDLKLVLAPKE